MFLLLGASDYSMEFGTLLRLGFMRMGKVLPDTTVLTIFNDPEFKEFVKLTAVTPDGDVLYDVSLQQAAILVGVDLRGVQACLDVRSIFDEIGVDLMAAGVDPVLHPVADALKIIFAAYNTEDRFYLAVVIGGILATRRDPYEKRLPPFSLHLTEVGMQLKNREAVDACLAWALPALRSESSFRLARFLAGEEFAQYFRVFDSPVHGSDKVAQLLVDAVWSDAKAIYAAQRVTWHGAPDDGNTVLTEDQLATCNKETQASVWRVLDFVLDEDLVAPGISKADLDKWDCKDGRDVEVGMQVAGPEAGASPEPASSENSTPKVGDPSPRDVFQLMHREAEALIAGATAQEAACCDPRSGLMWQEGQGAESDGAASDDIGPVDGTRHAQAADQADEGSGGGASAGDSPRSAGRGEEEPVVSKGRIQDAGQKLWPSGRGGKAVDPEALCFSLNTEDVHNEESRHEHSRRRVPNAFCSGTHDFSGFHALMELEQNGGELVPARQSKQNSGGGRGDEGLRMTDIQHDIDELQENLSAMSDALGGNGSPHNRSNKPNQSPLSEIFPQEEKGDNAVLVKGAPSITSVLRATRAGWPVLPEFGSHTVLTNEILQDAQASNPSTRASSPNGPDALDVHQQFGEGTDMHSLWGIKNFAAWYSMDGKCMKFPFPGVQGLEV